MATPNCNQAAFLAAHMERKHRNEMARKYGSHDHFDLWCVVGGIAFWLLVVLWSFGVIG